MQPHPVARFSFSAPDASGRMTLKFSQNALNGTPEEILDALQSAADRIGEVLSGLIEVVRGDVVS